MASTIASTLDLSRPSEKFGTHSTSVDIREEHSWPTREWQLHQSNECRLAKESRPSAPTEELPNSQPDLHRIHPRIRPCQSGIRNVHVAQFEAHVMLRAQDVH